MIRPPTYSGPAIYFNFEIPEFNRKEVRQAIAHVINREENGIVSLGASGVAVQLMTGMSDNLAPHLALRRRPGPAQPVRAQPAKG